MSTAFHESLPESDDSHLVQQSLHGDAQSFRLLYRRHEKRGGDRDLGKVIGTRYPLDVQDALLQLKDAQGFVRSAVESPILS
ncbi:hypothetical protein JOY44_26300 (plasmid) [Phormidium sp. CLA17]|nr:hypothetical protein [Leptolyngbya sp. Cla-17]